MRALAALLIGFSMVPSFSHAADVAPGNHCAAKARAVIGATLQSMGIQDFGFELESVATGSKVYDGAPLVHFSAKMIVNNEGYYPGSYAEVVIAAGKTCSVRKVSVDVPGI